MKIGIVNQHFHIGGVETFLLSLIRQLKRMRNDVYVFLLEPDGENALLPDLLALGAVVEPFDVLRSKSNSLRSFDVLLVTNTNTFVETLRQLTRGCFEVERLIVGTYQTRMYCLDRGPLNLHNRLVRLLFSQMSAANVIFGNDACRDEHTRTVPAMARAPIIPLIIDNKRFRRRAPRDHDAPLRIISIGRLDHFKTYNITMIDVLRRLLDKGHDVTWEIYGSGPLKAIMTRRIGELGLQNQVRLLGDIDYPSIPEILNGAFAFVGSGISMMEAATCGVPSLPAIEYDSEPRTFGFPHEIPGISFFEPGISLPRYDLADKLESLIGVTSAEYEFIGDAGREKMSTFFAETVAHRYIQTFETATSKRPILNLIPHCIYKVSAKVHRAGFSALKLLNHPRS